VTQLSIGATLGVPRSLGGSGLANSGGGVDARLRHERGGRCSAVRRGVGMLEATCTMLCIAALCVKPRVWRPLSIDELPHWQNAIEKTVEFVVVHTDHILR